MVAIDIVYEGALRTNCLHLPSQSRVETDAPVDNQGRGERFSPTDLVATALGSCVLTIIGIAARKAGFVVDGARVRVEKHMADGPRRIGKLVLTFDLPPGLSPEAREVIERTPETCPVRESLHPGIEVLTRFRYPD